VREQVCRSGELPDHFVQVLNAGEGVARIVDEGRCLRLQTMQTPVMLIGCMFDAEVEADDLHLPSLEMEMELFELFARRPCLMPGEVFLPVDGKGSAGAFSAKII
jgi:hypothetical protein